MKITGGKLLSFAALALLLPFFSTGQPISCGTDQRQGYLLANDPVYAARAKAQTESWRQHNLSMSQGKIKPTANGPVYEIPVVVHIIHTGGAIGTFYNPASQQIQSWLDSCNKIYASQSSFFPDTLNGGVYVPLRLVLAVRDPSCNPTSGIERIDGSPLGNYATDGVKDYTGAGTGVSDTALKALSLWPHESYFNIWVVTTIAGGSLAGFSSMPQPTPYLDGVVIEAGFAQTNPSSAQVLVHEAGHYFGLLHTFWGSNGSSCPPNANCLTDGDEICDTEPHIQAPGCPTGINSCTGVNYNNVEYNIMNYSSCPNRFTTGQKNKMLFSLLNYRYNLLTSRGLTPPGNDTVLTPPVNLCTPTSITNLGNNFDVGLRNVLLADMIVNTTGYTYDGFQFYVDHTLPNCLQPQPVAHLDRNAVYTITVTTGSNPENVRGWIDFNNDGTFSNAELIISSNGTLFDETHTNTFTIPTNIVPCTPLRMRIASDISGPPAPTSCSNPQYGQTEDFMVIINPLSPSVAIGVQPSATIAVGTTVTFTAGAVNGGSNPQYEWRRNGQPIAGMSTATWQATAGSSFVSGDIITARLISNASCIKPDSAISNAITMKATVVTGISSLTARQTVVVLYPNPNKGSFVVEGDLNSPGDYELVITNVMGQRVYEKTLNITDGKMYAELHTEDLPAGAYSLSLLGKDQILHRMFYIF